MSDWNLTASGLSGSYIRTTKVNKQTINKQEGIPVEGLPRLTTGLGKGVGVPSVYVVGVLMSVRDGGG